MSDTLLTLRDVHINFPARKNWLGKTTEHVHAINGIDLQIRRGETLGIVGESGCGKSTLAQLLMGMLQPSHGQYIRFWLTTHYADGVSGPALFAQSALTGVAHHHRTALDS